MTSTARVKHELTGRPLPKECCRRCELMALVHWRGYLTLRNGRRLLSITVGRHYPACYVFQLLKSMGVKEIRVIRQQRKRLGKTSYLLQVYGAEAVEDLLVSLKLQEPGEQSPRFSPFPMKFDDEQRCCQRAFLRGVFLAAGSLSVSSRSGYHLEIGCSSPEDAESLQKLMNIFSLEPSLRRRDKTSFLYIKKGDAVADFLRVIGAYRALLELESGRVVKSMRNQVNRLVNCDTANLEKVVATAHKQLALIEEAEERIGLHNLPPSLQEVAHLRRSHPEASLRELGEMLRPPLGKSGISHRFRQLEKLVRDLESRDGEKKRAPGSL